VRLRGHAASGVTFAGIPAGDLEAAAGFVAELREIRTRRGGSVVLSRAPVELEQRVGAWGYAGDALDLMRRVKEKFDPSGTMSPGRFVGGI
jgi:glycolate oxidase FAD binding subunit